MKSAHFLTKDRHGGYQFRRKIPKDLRPYFLMRQEIRKSLRTHHRPSAIRHARRCAVLIDEVFEQLNRIVKKQYEKERDAAEVEIAAIRLMFEKVFEYFDEQTIQNAINGNPTEEFTAVWTMILDELKRLDSLSDNYDLADMKICLLDEMRENDLARRAAEQIERDLELPSGAMTGTRSAAQTAIPQVASGDPISTYWSKYKAQKLADKEWKSPAIAEGFLVMLQSFIELAGDLRPTEVTRQVCIAYTDELLDYPLRRFAGANSSKSLDELRSRSTKRLSLTTRNGYLTAISTYFDWLIERELMSENWISKAKLIPKRDERSEKREAFTPDDLKGIFSDERFRGTGTKRRNWQYWIPLLGLFTGARIEELAQLRGIDIRQSADIPDVWFISISDRDDFTGKTENAVRVIPVHPKLMNLGFIEFVRSIGKDHLFPEQPNSRGSRGHKMTSDFRRLKESLGFGPKKVFHSFRNTFVNALSRAGVADSKVAALVGHAQDSVTFSRYWHAHEEELNEATRRINFDDVVANVEKWRANPL